MTLTTGPNLGLLVNGNAGEGHYTELMKQWRGLDALVMPRVDGYLVNTPPASPADGYTAIIGAAPTGLWAGKGGKVTRWSAVASAYEFYTPRNGWTFQSASARETYRYTASAWEIYYQEGTWTPALVGSITAGTQTYAIQSGYFTKIGRIATASFRTALSAKDAATSGNMRITGLPFAVNNSALIQAAGSSGYVGGVNFASATFVSMTADNGLSYANLFKWTASGSASVVDSEVTSSTDICGTFVYTT